MGVFCAQVEASKPLAEKLKSVSQPVSHITVLEVNFMANPTFNFVLAQSKFQKNV
jgi:hypothetical protein